MGESIVIDDPEREDNNNAIEDRSNTLPNNVQEVTSKRKRTAPVWSCISEVQSEGGKGSCSSKCNFCNHIFLMNDDSISKMEAELLPFNSIFSLRFYQAVREARQLRSFISTGFFMSYQQNAIASGSFQY